MAYSQMGTIPWGGSGGRLKTLSVDAYDGFGRVDDRVLS